MNVNYLLVIVIILVLYKLFDGYKKGMVKEIISLVSMAVLCAVAALIAEGIGSYNDGRIFNVVVAGILLVVLLIVHQLLKAVFFSAKLVSKLPVVHFMNKLLGAVFGVLEVVLFLWTVYTLTMMLKLGAIGEIIISYTRESPVLVWVYEHNYLAYLVEILLAKFKFNIFFHGE